MKKQIYIVVVLMTTTITVSLGKTPAKKVEPARQEQVQQTPIIVRKATGPTGFGSLKIGMTKSEVEALQASDGVSLSEPMTPNPTKGNTLKPGEDSYKGSLYTPLNAAPLEAFLTFTEGKLSLLSISLKLVPNGLEKLNSQLTEKYGPGKIEDTRKDEQCIYKNGANFKITSGSIQTKWTEDATESAKITTALNDYLLDSCPSDLRWTRFEAINVKSIIIRQLAPEPRDNLKSLF